MVSPPVEQPYDTSLEESFSNHDQDRAQLDGEDVKDQATSVPKRKDNELDMRVDGGGLRAGPYSLCITAPSSPPALRNGGAPEEQDRIRRGRQVYDDICEILARDFADEFAGNGIYNAVPGFELLGWMAQGLDSKNIESLLIVPSRKLFVPSRARISGAELQYVGKEHLGLSLMVEWKNQKQKTSCMATIEVAWVPLTMRPLGEGHRFVPAEKMGTHEFHQCATAPRPPFTPLSVVGARDLIYLAAGANVCTYFINIPSQLMNPICGTC